MSCPTAIGGDESNLIFGESDPVQFRHEVGKEGLLPGTHLAQNDVSTPIAGEKAFPLWIEGDGRDVVRMVEPFDLLVGLQVPEQGRAVEASGQSVAAVSGNGKPPRFRARDPATTEGRFRCRGPAGGEYRYPR